MEERSTKTCSLTEILRIPRADYVKEISIITTLSEYVLNVV